MLRKLFCTVAVVLSVCAMALAQGSSGTLQGKIIDKETGETMPFVNVIVLDASGSQIGGASTDFDGKYVIKPIAPGTYTVKVSFVGYQEVNKTGVEVSSGKITPVNFELTKGIEMETVIIQESRIIEADQTSTGKTMKREELDRLPVTNALGAVSLTAGVASQDGEVGSFRGSRSGADIYIDGVRIRGNINLPLSSIEEVNTITGGVPAEYGDNTGGIISYTTRGPSTRFFGNVEGLTSQFFDNYGFNNARWFISGPIIKGRDSSLFQGERSILGYTFAGDIRTVKDPSPSAIGVWQVKDDVLKDIQENPLRQAPEGGGTLKNAEFVTLDDLENVPSKENARFNALSLQSKLEYQPLNSKINVTLSGNFEYNQGRGWSTANSLFNNENNPISRTYRGSGYARFTQRFINEVSSEADTVQSLIKNAYYTVQFDYVRSYSKTTNEFHGDNIFNYGYLGDFTTYRENLYRYGQDTVNGKVYTAWLHQAFVDTAVTFERSELNPITANYTSRFYELMEQRGTLPRNTFDILQNGGLLNGNLPPSVYSLYSNVGSTSNSFGYGDAAQYRFNVFGAADLRGHEIKLGLQYEQRSDRSYAINPVGLWSVMRNLANFHIRELDFDSPNLVTDENGVFQDTIIYDRKVSDNQRFFDKQLRQKLGLAVNGTDYIDIDSYDPGTYSVDMFSADELLNDGNPLVAYYGYDHIGNRLNKRPSFADFFTERDSEGNFTRPIAPFEPIYIAGYIQDKFSFDDLIFNVGLRVDRFDANQKVLKDPYLLYEGVTAGEDSRTDPENIGDDYVVYVKDINAPASSDIVGYRNGDTWYDKSGNEIADPLKLAEKSTNGVIAPYLVNPGANIRNAGYDPSGAFKDYDPQINFMPRISFSFPISTDALFFAHYDVLTERPAAVRLDPTDYLFIENNVGGLLSNPNLQPEKTTDYEIGFQQALSLNSALKLSAYYRELRDMIQVVQINQAYPVSYLSFRNIDFGTVKGFTAGYEMRRTKNVQLNVNYTLQFAEATGSSATSGASLVGSGQPNLRVVIPRGDDQRHSFVGTFDYHFGMEEKGRDKYDGPTRGKKLLRGSGFNLVFRANSGRPYTRLADPVPILSGVSTRSTLKGNLNGSRLPWNFKLDLRVDKRFNIKYGQLDNKLIQTTVYLMVNNVLNARRIAGVYAATGNADDDGFLSSAQGQTVTATQVDPEAFVDLYRIKMNSPGNYFGPRIIRLGASFTFSKQ